MHLGRLGSAALTFDYFNMGSIESFTLDAAGNPLPDGILYPSAMALGLAWGGAFGSLGLGAELKGYQEDLTGGSLESGALADLGARWILGQGWRLGASIQNLALNASGDLKPARIHGGLAYTLMKGRPLAAELDGEYQPNDHSAAVVRGGIEWALVPSLALRGGYVLGGPDEASGPTAGLGWFSGSLEVDYALYAVGEVGYNHLLTIQLVP
jgi:hypothetical protein